MPLKKGLNLGERPNLLFHLLKSVLFDMCLLSEKVDQLNNVIVNKGTELFILAPDSVCDKGKDIKKEFCIDHIAPSIPFKNFVTLYPQFLAQFFIDVSR